MDKFDIFIRKEKFLEDNSLYYPGQADPTIRSSLTEKINLAAEDLRSVAKQANPVKQDYLNMIRNGLQRFGNSEFMFDTEDRERVCHYFEELMGLVELKSSEGLLNTFMYGFDPNDPGNRHPNDG